MFRILIWFLIFYFIYKVIKKLKVSNKNEKKTKTTIKEKMIKCENCGIYSPESSNIVKEGKYFCSKKCLEEFFNEKN